MSVLKSLFVFFLDHFLKYASETAGQTCEIKLFIDFLVL